MSWRNVTATAAKSAVDEVEQCLWTLGAVSVTVLDAAEDPLYEPGPGETPLWEQVRLVGLFDEHADLHALEQQFKNRGFGLPGIETLADRQWEREWLQHFQPMQFGHRLWVCPHELDIPGLDVKGLCSEHIVVKLDPGLAFGTGTHATTRLCLEWLDAREIKGKRVLDFGCGSGILGIAACLLGAEQVMAVDIDPQALTATRENAAGNTVLGQMSIATPEKIAGHSFDLVLANILAQPLIELNDTFCNVLRSGGDLILSGILPDQGARVRDAYGMLAFQVEVLHDGWLLQHYVCTGALNER